MHGSAGSEILDRLLIGLNGRWRLAPTWSAMRRLPDAEQKILAERRDSIFIGAGLDPNRPVATSSNRDTRAGYRPPSYFFVLLW